MVGNAVKCILLISAISKHDEDLCTNAPQYSKVIYTTIAYTHTV
jgi:hypothetical protein